jgi:hypothetical protein
VLLYYNTNKININYATCLVAAEDLTEFFGGEVEVYAVDILSEDTLDVCVNV